MRLGIISDTHLGFGQGTERENEAFENALNGARILAEQKVDAVLLPGDFFDQRIPSHEAWEQAFRIFSVFISAKESEAEVSVEKNNSMKKFEFRGIPVIGISGTHEHRSKDYVNAFRVLESGNFLAYLHLSRAAVRKGGEEIFVYGMSGVPEQYAPPLLERWNPKPEAGKWNCIMTHQSFKEFLPIGDNGEQAMLSLDNLPRGFSLYLNGHFHWHNEKDFALGKFLIPGSTIITQMKQLESKKPKGVLVLDTVSGKTEFFEIPNQRKLYYEKMEFKGSSPALVSEALRRKISSVLASHSESLKPLIRIRLSGTLEKGSSQSDISLSAIESEFSANAILSIDRNFSSQEFGKRIEDLREMQAQKKSVAETGIEMLEANLSQTSFNNAFDARRLFELLSSKDRNCLERAMAALMEEKTD
ncbi:MAG: metallophosphoesterase [archaeon]